MIARPGMRGARHFLEGFLPAWIAGAEAPVRLPLGLAEVETAVHLLERSGIADRIVHARTRLARRFLAGAPRQDFDGRDLRLAAVVYNLLALGHPAMERVDARPGGVEDVALFTASLLEHLDPPRTIEAALSAHTLVGRFFAAERNDSLVSTWLRSYIYRGQPVPKGITRFRRLRSVRVHGERVEGCGMLETGDQFELMDRLLLHSPLTDLLHPDRVWPRFRLSGLARWLAEARVCRAVLYRWVRAPSPAKVGEALASALYVRVRGEAPAEEIRLVAHALYHLHLLLLLETQHLQEPSLGVGDLVGRWKVGEAAYFPALLLSLRGAAEAVGLPTDASLGDALAERLSTFDAVASEVVREDAWVRAETIVSAIRTPGAGRLPAVAAPPRRLSGVE